MKRQIGFLLQLAVMSALPVICVWQLLFGFPLIWMPALLVVGIGVFWLGTTMRESR